MSEGDKVAVSFACQSCMQPIFLEEGLDNIDVHSMAELACKHNKFSLSILLYI